VATLIRSARRAADAHEWALVLAAEGIPHLVEPDGAGFGVIVADDDVPRARAALDVYDGEAQAAAVPRAPVASSEVAWTVGVAAGAALLAFFVVTGPPRDGSRWFAQGAAVAGHLLGGEPWRALTALTLHVDGVHVAGNALATAALLAAVVRQLGAGLAVSLVLLAGAAGNLLSALAQDPRHAAVGFSSATFGAIGILAALRLVPGATTPASRRSRWLVPAASLLLLAMLGASPGADVLAHALGLLSGGALGLVAGVALRRPLGRRAQWALAALAVGTVAVAWRAALLGSAG